MATYLKIHGLQWGHADSKRINAIAAFGGKGDGKSVRIGWDVPAMETFQRAGERREFPLETPADKRAADKLLISHANQQSIRCLGKVFEVKDAANGNRLSSLPAPADFTVEVGRRMLVRPGSDEFRNLEVEFTLLNE
ncbi:hypothetical protein GT347_02905 [Xylophilus rhododendri]|uniref:Uncharacterized protein n=1 Tax=Xylophilus rhododendri TaxID=2697032 RepID=A0A857IZJ7_9BURK|nr:hypothetical protein [Xylophilus rhododendri]QHI97024.1 hypothetical protein GT347_02905 [Xylophilus rhododendri]